MADSGRAETIRRLTGGALLALCVGLAIARAGAQQQAPSPSANVNVISGTGADGDWTLQRQNEPTMACSSRNPQNCLAGANDYRTVDIPFPTIGEKITGDAWLGWYTTKNGGLTWRTRLLPGYPQDVSPAGLASPLRGYPAGADPIIRPGTNGLFYYGGLVFSRDEDGGSAIFVARFIDNNNQEGIGGRTDCLSGRVGRAPHRRGPDRGPTARPGRPSRHPSGRTAACTRGAGARRAPAGSARARRAREGQEETGPGRRRTVGRADGRQALDGGRRSRAPERRCAPSAGPAPACRCRRFQAGASTWRTRSSMARAKSAGGSCSATRPTAPRRGARRA